MKDWLRKWLEGLGTAFPSSASSYWRTMSLGRMKKLLAAAFFTVCVVGFVLAPRSGSLLAAFIGRTGSGHLSR